MPWSGVDNTYGQFIRWVWMPPRQAEFNQKVVEEPGYWVAESTLGYTYPARWTLQPDGAGSFRWALSPSNFVRR